MTADSQDGTYEACLSYLDATGSSRNGGSVAPPSDMLD